MARLDGIREKTHNPIYDSVVRGIGISTVQNGASLFGNTNVGQKQFSNMKAAAQLPSDQTFIIKVLRGVAAFQSLADDEFAAFGQLTALNTNVTGTNARAEDLYTLVAYGAYFTLTVGEKPMFTAPFWYAPAGGGPAGFTTENARHIITNGVASHQSILRLGKDIHMPARQNFQVTIDWFPFARLGDGQGGAIGADLSPLDYLNQFDGLKVMQFFVDGLITRDVQ